MSAFFWRTFQIETISGGERIIVFTDLGKYLLGLFIVAYAFGLLQLESTYRAATGSIRRMLLPPAVGFACLLAVLLVSASLGLLYSAVRFQSVQISALVSIIMLVLVARFLVFEEQQQQRVVISRQAVYSSVGILLVGAYLVLVGLALKLLTSLGGSPKVFFSALVAFVVILLFLALLLSGSVKVRLRRLIDRTLLAGKIDLPGELASFADDVTATVDQREMLDVTARVLADRCGLADIEIVLRGEKQGEFYICYPQQNIVNQRLPELEDWLLRYGRMTLVATVVNDLAEISEAGVAFLNQAAEKHFIPLIARHELVGFISCRADSRISADVKLLLETISHQLALSLLSARQYEALIETKELASFHKVSSFVIHDVKNLISMLSMILQNAERKFNDPRFQQATIDTLAGAQARMKRMISRLTAPSAQIDYEIDECDLQKIVHDLLQQMRLSENEKLQVKIDIPTPPSVRGNEEKLGSIISNLLINALEAMPDGGELQVATDQDKDHVSITVADNGVGMTEEFMREKLFRPFKTSKPGGLGIGLFQSRELARQMGGELTVRSTVNKGSAFTLRLKKA
ncbi:MAG: PEP-CTERM system histidine kinase PrsK, partial [candidate division Zixibacteria bacterium]|nr:PEP-CTERM system histidine kinase PrsK [candidate division Zixibacteria bacterium]